MTNTTIDCYNQDSNDFIIDTFYWMHSHNCINTSNEAMYRALSWVEDDNEYAY